MMSLDSPAESAPALDSPADDVRATVEALQHDAPAPVPSAPAERSSAPLTDAAKATDAAAARARDEKGRFSSRSAEKPQNGAVAPELDLAPEQIDSDIEPRPSEAKPPASWKPAAREKWAALPPEVQAEATRRERETDIALQSSAGARRLAGELEKVIAPHLPMLQADNTHPLQALDSSLRVMATLRTGTPQNKAAMLAHLTQAFGVDVQLLDEALAGQSQPQAQKPTEYRDSRVDQLLGAMRHVGQQRQQAVLGDARAEVTKFGEAHEYLEHVRHAMAALIDSAAAQGVDLSLDDAYSRACWADPEIRGRLQQKDAASQAQTAQAATARARNASSSVRSAPAPGVSPQESGSIEDDVRASVARSRR